MLQWEVSKDCSGKETFEQRSELSKGVRYGVILGRAALAEEITNVKVLSWKHALVCLRDKEKFNMTEGQ